VKQKNEIGNDLFTKMQIANQKKTQTTNETN